MTESIIVAIITGTLALLGTVITVWFSSKKQSETMRADVKTQLAVFDTKLDLLTKEVHEHIGFAKRLPVLEEKMQVANHRIADLEKDIKTIQGGVNKQ